MKKTTILMVAMLMVFTTSVQAELVALWHLDGDAVDSSGNGNDGTVYGATYDSGYYGQALRFDGDDDYVDCGSSATLKPTVDITIEMWVKPNSTQAQYADILGGHQNNQGYVVQQNSTNLNQYYFAYNKDGTGSGWQGESITTQLTADVWQYFVVQKEGNTIRHYLNGILSASGSVSGNIWYSPMESFYLGIGWLLDSDRYFTGAIDEVRIWDVALTELPGILPVAIDIKPGNYPNPINLGSNGVIPVAILSSPDFDATTVKPETVFLGGAGVALRGKGNKEMAHEEDVNGDGLIDMVVQVETQAAGLWTSGDVILTAETSSGLLIQGYDEVVIVPAG